MKYIKEEFMLSKDDILNIFPAGSEHTFNDRPGQVWISTGEVSEPMSTICMASFPTMRFYLKESFNVVVDDLRAQPDGWTLFKTGEEFLEWLKSNKQAAIAHLSLDHDLGEGVMTGYDLVKKLVDNFPKIDRITLHTDNNVGFKNMYLYLVNARREHVIPAELVIEKQKFNLHDGKLVDSGFSYVSTSR